jgi:hypothetical protein
MATKSSTPQRNTRSTTAAPAAAAKKPQALVNRERNTDLAKPSAEAARLLADAGQGIETMGREDVTIPRISILQKGSPQVDKAQKDKFVPGAEQGDLYDNISNTVIAKGDEGILVIPCAYRRAHIEWVPRSAGGGFVHDHGANSSILAQTHKGEGDQENANLLPNGNEIVAQAEYLCLVFNEEDHTVKHAVISMAKKQMAKARKWNTLMTQLMVEVPGGGGRKINPAIFHRTYRLTTVPESNDKGAWFGWKIEPAEDTLALPEGDDVYANAKQFRLLAASGNVKVANPVADDGGTADETGDM